VGRKVTNTPQKRKKPDPKPKFQVGDRVKEIRKFQHNITNQFNQTAHVKRCLEIQANTRKGTVTKVFIKPDSRGSRLIFMEVLWDGFATPSEHAQLRLAPLDGHEEG